MEALNVWMNGALVGVWRHGRRRHGSFAYAPSWLASPLRRPLSLSIPITAGNGEVTGPQVDHYFDNLLPDSEDIRRRIQARTRARSTEPFELLTAIGRDCVGAVQLLPPDMAPAGFDRIAGRPLGEHDIAARLRDAAGGGGTVLGGDADAPIFRISLAGMQDKTALLRHEGQWLEPSGATPTTHIFKLPLGRVGRMQADMSLSIENEWLCGRILDAMGLPVAESEIAEFDGQKVLVVTRFDRERVQETPTGRPCKPWIRRLPQEDLCQASGLPPTLKYEHDGGPGVAACLRILQASEEPELDTMTFAVAQLAFWLLAAIDGHAKNFSIFWNRGGTFSMTPLYDVLSAWPVIGRGRNKLAYRDATLAMALRGRNAHYRLSTIQTRHWHALAQQAGGEATWQAMHELVDRAPTALASLRSRLPKGFPMALFDAVAQGVSEQVRRFQAGL